MDQELEAVQMAVVGGLVDGRAPRLVSRHSRQVWVAPAEETTLQTHAGTLERMMPTTMKRVHTQTHRHTLTRSRCFPVAAALCSI